MGKWFYVAACVGKADGWGVRACAVALTVGLIFWLLFDQAKSNRKKTQPSPRKTLKTAEFYP